MTLLLLGCSPSPLPGRYDAVIERALSSCSEEDDMPWYAPSDAAQITVDDVAPGSSFAFDIATDQHAGSLLCQLDEGSFDCPLETGDGLTFFDDVVVAGVWETASNGVLWWAMTRVCPDDMLEECVDNGTRNCAMTTHLALTRSAGQ